MAEKHEKKLIVIDYEGTPIVSSGAYVTRDRVGVYPFAANTVADGTAILQATAMFYRDKGFVEGVEAERKAAALREKKSESMVLPEPCSIEGCKGSTLGIDGGRYREVNGREVLLCRYHCDLQQIKQDKQVTLPITDHFDGVSMIPLPHSLTPAMSARPADELTQDNKALEPMVEENTDGE